MSKPKREFFPDHPVRLSRKLKTPKCQRLTKDGINDFNELLSSLLTRRLRQGHHGNRQARVIRLVYEDLARILARAHNLRLAVFTAQVIADVEDQPPETLERKDLRRIPVLYPGERQLPGGEGEPPPSEPALPGFEADLPGIEGD